MTILVLGSEGFIGSNLVSYFSALCYQVFKADIILKQENNYFIINPEALDFNSIFLKHSFDVCINATGAANVQLSYSNPDLDYTLDTANVYNILNSIRLFCPECKFINLSSAAVYGNPINLPIKETHPTNPVSPYGFHKLYSEMICQEFYKLFKIRTLNVRIFSAYGPGLKKQIFWDLHQKARQCSVKEIFLFGTGNETRDFIFIRDISVALEYIIKKISFEGQNINIGSGKEIKIIDIAKIFFEHYDPSIKINFNGLFKEGDPLHWHAEISKLISIGYQAETSINIGLEKTAKWLKGLG